jgi:hypothetical protein
VRPVSAAPPEVLEKVLGLRPTSAASRLGRESALPLLNPRDLARALDGSAAPLVCVPVAAADAVPGLLRAARDQDAVLGLGCPYRPGHREGPARFFAQVQAASEEIQHQRPVFLQAGPIRLASADPRALEQRASDIHRFLEAGFTLVSVDASGMEPEAAAAAGRELLLPVVERELSVEVSAPAPAGAQGPAGPDRLRRLLEAFRAAGIEVQFVRLRSAQVDPRALGALGEVARGAGAWLCVEDPGPVTPRLLAWGEAGVRKLDVGPPFSDLVLGALRPELRAALDGKARAAGLPAGELVARMEDPLAEGGAAARERVEALSYGEAFELFESAGALGSASAAMVYLSSRAGY